MPCQHAAGLPGLPFLVERFRTREGVGIGFQDGAELRTLPIELLDAREVGRDDGAGRPSGRVHPLPELLDRLLFQIEARGFRVLGAGLASGAGCIGGAGGAHGLGGG